MARTPTSGSRRRQRSVRVGVAVALLALSTATVVAAVLLAGRTALALAAGLSVALGWAAARIVHTELVQSRREHARERAAQAAAFKALFSERSAEHTAFAAAMGERLVSRDREVRELQGTLRLSECRADAAEDRVRREAQRATRAQQRVAELETVLALRAQEQQGEAAVASPVPGPAGAELDTVVDLLAWEDRTSAEHADWQQRVQKRA
jgi:hypothetical protein